MRPHETVGLSGRGPLVTVGVSGVGPLVIVGPSGAGKTTIAAWLVRSRPERFAPSVSVTTRRPRAGERNGREYRFVSEPEFEAMIDGGLLAEWALVHGRYYGTPLENLAADRGGGRRPVLDIDVQGARQVAERVAGAVQVFVVPPGPKRWLRRLAGRGTETPEEIVRRLRTAVAELEAAPSFALVVVNREVDQAAADVLSLVGMPAAAGSAGSGPLAAAGSAGLGSPAVAEPPGPDAVVAGSSAPGPASAEAVAALCRRLRDGARAEIARLEASAEGGPAPVPGVQT